MVYIIQKHIFYNKSNDYVYIFNDIEFYKKYINYTNYLTNNKKIFNNDKEINKILKPLKFKSKANKIKFINELLSKILKNIKYSQIKIIMKFIYYHFNFLNNNNNFKNYNELYNNLKKKGIEKKYNLVIKDIYNYTKDKIKKLDKTKIKNINVKITKL